MPKYVTVWQRGVLEVCSEHSSEKAAIKAAERCEKRGGAKHQVWKVEVIKRPKKKDGV